MAPNCALRAGRRRSRRQGGNVWCPSPGVASASRNMSKRCGICVARGYAVAMIDWRGQGHSSHQLRNPFKGHVENFPEYEIDVAAFVQQVVLPDCPPPYFALAHSMGGAVMLRGRACRHGAVRTLRALRADDRPAGPARVADDARPDAPCCAAGMGERFIPGGNVDLIKSTGFSGNPLTSDLHPLCSQRGDPGG